MPWLFQTCACGTAITIKPITNAAITPIRCFNMWLVLYRG
jgi:hypothetical protein